jgi:hypothetical protein
MLLTLDYSDLIYPDALSVINFDIFIIKNEDRIYTLNKDILFRSVL